MQITSEILSRAQFGFTVGFHILFPTLNLGLAVFLAFMEARWLYTKDEVYLKICRFWGKIFALTFGMGVVSGVVLAYEFGTNFGPFIKAFGGVVGALFTYETLTAFFLEAGFLGIMLFGWKRVSPRQHFMATLLVALGTTFSATWIMSSNSWMQTPAGYIIEQGQYLADDWLKMIFNPSFIPRFLHMVLASYVTTSFVVGGISAWYLLRQRHIEMAKRCLSTAVIAGALLMPVQLFLGDVVGLVIHKHQPVKTAAMEGLWETTRGAPLLLFAWPDQKTQSNTYEIAIPKLASFINTHSWDGELQGLKDFARADQPHVLPVFFTFRIMVGLGLLMMLTAFYGLWVHFRGKLVTSRWLQRAYVCLIPAGFIATVSGWLTSELGRQPWIVYGLMRTSEAASNVSVQQVAVSLGLFMLVYGVIFFFYLFFMFRYIRKGPKELSKIDVDQHLFQYMSAMHTKGGE